MPDMTHAMTPTVLQTVWFALWGLLWAIYLCLDGFDLGAGILMPLLARSDAERAAVHRAVEPYWDGNEVWLIAAGGVTFAAFPRAYAIMFSALYAPLMLILFALIVRGAMAAFRPALRSAVARWLCDALFALSSFVAALLLGVAFANLFVGLPLGQDGTLRGGIPALLQLPAALAGGGLVLLALAMHGAIWLAGKTEGYLARRAARLGLLAWVGVVVLAVVFFVLCHKQHPALFHNYSRHVWLGIVFLLIGLGGVVSGIGLLVGQTRLAWWASSLLVTGVVAFGMAGIHPTMLPSRLDASWGVRVAEASSSPLTLKIMLAVALVFVPIIVAYQAWVYWTLRGPAVAEEGEGY